MDGSAFCSNSRVHQPAGQSDAPHCPDSLGNTSWIPAAVPFQPLVSKAEASRQPNPVQGTAPAAPSSPRLQLQNLIPLALPLVFA